MVSIFPLNGWFYGEEHVNDFSKVITPPNDVISSAKKEDFKRKSPFNFVRLILPDGGSDKYENAAKLLQEWISKRIIIRDEEKAIYIYAQTCILGGKEVRRTGFISLLYLEDFGRGVLPHEKILEKDLQDRIMLASAVKADLEIPFFLYDDRERKIDSLIEPEIKGKTPNIDFRDDDCVRHQLWKITNLSFLQNVQEEMDGHQCIVADGHHRYTSELKVRDILNVPGAAFGLVCFVNSFNEGTVILPTNRIVFSLTGLDVNQLLERLREIFVIEKVGEANALAKRVRSTPIMIDKANNLKNHVFGMYDNINRIGYLLKLKDSSILTAAFPNGTDVYCKIDINILHKAVIEGVLGITGEQQKNRENIDFIKGDEETIRKLVNPEVQLAFFVNPPLLREVFLTARAGEIMPQKSTYFYPKVFSGLVLYRMDDG